MKQFFFALVLVSSGAFASELPIDPYLKMQEALASDNFPEAVEAHKKICSKKDTLKGKYNDCGRNFKSIDDLRSSFKKLSEVYVKHVDTKKMKGIMKASCPMAEAKWIQKEGKLANPYYGKTMLECGEKI